MVFDRDPFTIEELTVDENITRYLKLNQSDIDGFTISEKCDLWADTINYLFRVINNSKEQDFSRILKVFSVEALAYIQLHAKAKIHENFMGHYFSRYDHKVDILESIELTTWQWYDEKPSADVCSDVFNALYSLDKDSFYDHRFTVYPLYTKAPKQGRDRSPWLMDVSEGYVSLYDDDLKCKVISKSDRSAYNSNYMDAKLGLLICFKDLPSMMVSFNFDNDRNILVHQIQCKPKDRGHYKIKNWQQYILSFLSDLFVGFNIMVLSGDQVVDLVMAGYQRTRVDHPDIYDHVVPKQETLDRVKQTYDQLVDPSQFIMINDEYKYCKVA